MKKDLLTILFTIFVLICFFICNVSAEVLDELQQLKNEYSYQLNQINSKIINLQEMSNNISVQIDDTNSEIIDLKVQILQAQDAIEQTRGKIRQTKKEIMDKDKELREVNKKKDKQYQNMKKRIKYIYENADQNNLLVTICTQGNLVDILNKAEYTSQLHKYDRQMLQKYVKTIQKIERIEQQLKKQKQQLEDQNKFLYVQKLGLEQNKNKLEGEILELKQEKENLGLNIAEALEDADALANEIVLLDYRIAEVEAERQEIIKKQTMLMIAAEQQYYSTTAASSYSSEQVEDQYTYSSPQQIFEQVQKDILFSYDIVSYANEFVGNPYVYGGNSLTNGIDCSHFVYQVLTNTGNYDGEYVTSTSWAGLGDSVSSLDQAIAGDVIVYSGHVAIYDGEGGLIEAQSPSAGITNTRSADSSTIIAIRRFE